MFRAIRTTRSRSAQSGLFPFATAHSGKRAPGNNGGIAQLVERQLCKLDVWGSNPHASTRRRAARFEISNLKFEI
jgi:hypothetical protein